MPGQIDLQARLAELRARAQSAMPGALQRARAGGRPLDGSLADRAREMAGQRPILGQAMQGKLLSGGRANAASVLKDMRQAGFRPAPSAAAEPPPSAPQTTTGYRPIT